MRRFSLACAAFLDLFALARPALLGVLTGFTSQGLRLVFLRQAQWSQWLSQRERTHVQIAPLSDVRTSSGL